MFQSFTPAPTFDFPGLKDVLAKYRVKAASETIKEQINDGGGIEREELADEQPANDGDAQRVTKLGAGAASQRERQRAEERSHGGHHDGTKPQ